MNAHTPTENRAYWISQLNDKEFSKMVKAVNMHDELVEALKVCSQYLDNGNYKENATQYELYKTIQLLIVRGA